MKATNIPFFKKKEGGGQFDAHYGIEAKRTQRGNLAQHTRNGNSRDRDGSYVYGRADMAI